MASYRVLLLHSFRELRGSLCHRNQNYKDRLTGKIGLEGVRARIYLFTLARRGHPAAGVGHGKTVVGTSSASKKGTTFGFGV